MGEEYIKSLIGKRVRIADKRKYGTRLIVGKEYTVSGVIMRKRGGAYYYQLELTDNTISGTSVLICDIDDIEER